MNFSDDVRRLNPELEKFSLKHVQLAVPKKGVGINGHRFRSALEARAWREVEVWLGMRPEIMRYEALTLHLPGGRYTPDFYLRRIACGRLWLVEVKSDRAFAHHRSGRGARRAIKEAATVYTDLADFWLLTPEGKDWNLERVFGDPGKL
jgi:hypothetical protein